MSGTRATSSRAVERRGASLAGSQAALSLIVFSILNRFNPQWRNRGSNCLQNSMKSPPERKPVNSIVDPGPRMKGGMSMGIKAKGLRGLWLIPLLSVASLAAPSGDLQLVDASS